MQNQPLFFLLYIWLCGSSLIAQSIQQPKSYSLQPTASENITFPTAAISKITTDKYCTFLKTVAASDPHHLYDEKIGSDLECGCILRSGVVGSYSYSVVQGKESSPITFLSWLDAMRYCNWLENGSITSFVSSEDSDVTEYGSYELQGDQLISINPNAIYLVENNPAYDTELGSSSFEFQIINTTAASSLAKTSSGSNGKDTSWDEKVVGVAAGVGIILGGGGEEHIAESASGEKTSTPVDAKVSSVSDKPTETATKSLSLNSPLMMFSGDEETPIKEVTDPRQTLDSRLTTSTTTSSGQPQRGAATSGIVEDSSSNEKSAVDNESFNSAIRRGGLSNNRADCFINSSLQLCKAFKEQLDRDALIQMPSLTRFLNEGLSNDPECRTLRQEMATQVIKNAREFNPMDNDGIVRPVVINGTAQTHQDAAAFLGLLLDETRAPELFFEETLENQITQETRLGGQLNEGRILTLALGEYSEKRIEMQALVDQRMIGSMRNQRWIDEDLNSPKVGVLPHLKLQDPPPTLVVSLGRFGYDSHGVKNQTVISGFQNRITLLAANGDQINYEPTAIICHIGNTLEEGHYITHRKENGPWKAFNDTKVINSVFKEDGNASKNCYVIAYRRVPNSEIDDSEADLLYPSKAKDKKDYSILSKAIRQSLYKEELNSANENKSVHNLKEIIGHAIEITQKNFNLFTKLFDIQNNSTESESSNTINTFHIDLSSGYCNEPSLAEFAARSRAAEGKTDKKSEKAAKKEVVSEQVKRHVTLRVNSYIEQAVPEQLRERFISQVNSVSSEDHFQGAIIRMGIKESEDAFNEAIWIISKSITLIISELSLSHDFNNNALSSAFNKFKESYLEYRLAERNYQGLNIKLPSVDEIVNTPHTVDLSKKSKEKINLGQINSRIKTEKNNLISLLIKIYNENLKLSVEAKISYNSLMEEQLNKTDKIFNNAMTVTRALQESEEPHFDLRKFNIIINNFNQKLVNITAALSSFSEEEFKDANDVVKSLENATEIAKQIEKIWNQKINSYNTQRIHWFKNILDLAATIKSEDTSPVLYSLGFATEKKANLLGKIWVGDNPDEVTDDGGSKMLRSRIPASGPDPEKQEYRQYRFPQFKDGTSQFQANFERLAIKNKCDVVKAGGLTANGHLTIRGGRVLTEHRTINELIDHDEPVYYDNEPDSDNEDWNEYLLQSDFDFDEYFDGTDFY